MLPKFFLRFFKRNLEFNVSIDFMTFTFVFAVCSQKTFVNDEFVSDLIKTFLVKAIFSSLLFKFSLLVFLEYFLVFARFEFHAPCILVSYRKTYCHDILSGISLSNRWHIMIGR